MISAHRVRSHFILDFRLDNVNESWYFNRRNHITFNLTFGIVEPVKLLITEWTSDRRLIPGKCRDILSSPRPDRLWGQSALPSNEYGEKGGV